MFSLMTGRKTTEAQLRDELDRADKPVTSEECLVAMRRNLVEASKRLSSVRPGDIEAAAVLAQAATAHALAAQAAPKTPPPTRPAHDSNVV